MQRREKAQFVEEAMPHMGALYRSALGMTRNGALAEDLVQDTYQEAWKSFHRYTPGSDCKAWLFRILFRLWGRHRRKAGRIRQVDMAEVPEGKLAQQPDIQRKMEHETVLTILRTLPDHYQSVLVLADVEELRYREIAHMLELPIGTVMSRLNRARSLLREKFLQESARSKSESA